MNRRAFLAALAAGWPVAAAARQISGPPRRAVIVGAGLAGLAAGLTLREAGWTVTILEARARAGGRVHTMREAFSDGLYAEAGAARIQDSHTHTLRYAKQFELALDPFWPSAGNNVTYVAGRRVVTPQGRSIDFAQLPLDFSAEERKTGMASLARYLFAHLKDVGDPTAADWPTRDLSHLEVPIAELCRRNGATPAFMQMVQLGHDLREMSALHLLRDAAVAAPTRQWFKIRGGNDRLPAALAAQLSTVIRYGAPVVQIAQDDRVTKVTYRRDDSPVTVEGDYVISTLPTPVLNTVEIRPTLPEKTRLALREVGAMAMARVFLQTSRRFWTERGDTGWGSTDDPIDVWDYTRDQPGQRGILGAYLSGSMARRVTDLAPTERGGYILERMERLHPGTREHFETSASYSWIADPWARGAAAEFHPGQLSRFYQTLRAPAGRIHFAGEHTSPWGGWMNGALESGHRVAAELIARVL